MFVLLAALKNVKLDLSQLPPWAVPAAGAAAALLLILMAMSLRGRRRESPPEPPRRGVLNIPRENASRDGLGEERRRWFRRGGNPTLVVITPGRGDPWEGMVVDRSQGGLCLLMDREPQKGTVLSVRMAQAPEHIPAVEVRTVWSRPVGDRWHIGCQFTKQPPLNVLLFFG